MENIKENLLEKSDAIDALAGALSKFQGEVKTVSRDAENPFFHSKYASLEAIIEAIREPLAKSGLSYSQFPTGRNKLVTVLMHSSGQYLMSTVEMTPKDTSPQAQGSSITYARRYSLSAILGLATDEDDDGNTASEPKKAQTVKTGKVGSEEAFAKAVLAIEKYTTVAQLEKAMNQLAVSKKFTDTQKDKLDSLISQRIDVLTAETT